MALDFVYAQPVKIFFGRGKFAELGDVLDELGVTRAVLCCGRHFAAEARALQEREPRIVAVFDRVQQDPQLAGVTEAVRLARVYCADGVIGIGGGSSLDTAKFTAAVAPNAGEPIDYYEGRRALMAEHRLPVIAVPTTAGTGSEVTQVSVVSNGSEKKTVNHPAFMPAAAIVDPLLTVGVPPRTTMNTGLDALAHALEGYWSRNHQSISDLMAVEAVRLVLGHLEQAYRDGSDLEAREGMAMAALLGGLSFALPKTAGCHACSYPLSETFHIPHGEACAFTLDSFVRLYADERLEELCRRAGLRDTEELAERIAALKALGGLRTRLRDLGEADPDALARAAAAHPLMRNGPVPMDEAALRALFEKLA